MTSNPETPYKVSRVPKVGQQINEIANHARAMGFYPKFVSALEQVLRTLQSAPGEWGDPQYNKSTQVAS